MISLRKNLLILGSFFFFASAGFGALLPSSIGSSPSVVAGTINTLQRALGLDYAAVEKSLGRYGAYTESDYCGVSLQSYTRPNSDRAREFLSLNVSVLFSRTLSIDEKNRFLDCTYGDGYDWTNVILMYSGKDASLANQIQDMFNQYVISNQELDRVPSNARPITNVGSGLGNSSGVFYKSVIRSFKSLFNVAPLATQNAIERFSVQYGSKFCGVDSRAFRSGDMVTNFVNLFASVLMAPIPKQDRDYFFSCVFDNTESSREVFQFSDRYGPNSASVLQRSLYQTEDSGYTVPSARVGGNGQPMMGGAPSNSNTNNPSFYNPSSSAFEANVGTRSNSTAPVNIENRVTAPAQAPTPSLPVNTSFPTNPAGSVSPIIITPPNNNNNIVVPPSGGSNGGSTTTNNNNTGGGQPQRPPIILYPTPFNSNGGVAQPNQGNPPQMAYAPPTIVIAQNGGSAQQPLENQNKTDVAQQQQQQQSAPPAPAPAPQPYYPPPYPYPPYPYPPPAAPAPTPAPAPAPAPQVAPAPPRPQRPPQRRPPQRRPPQKPPAAKPAARPAAA